MKWLTTAEAADELEVSPSTVRRLVEEGELKSKRRTRHGPLLISEESIEDYMDSLEDGDTEHPEVERAYDEGYDEGVRDAECGDDDEDDEDDDFDDDEDDDDED